MALLGSVFRLKAHRFQSPLMLYIIDIPHENVEDYGHHGTYEYKYRKNRKLRGILLTQ